MEEINLLQSEKMPVFEQLQLEEALLRCDDRNFCIINVGSPAAIVMGMSNKAKLHVRKDVDIPVIKRFSGGGSVVVDKDTLFVSFIFNKADLEIEAFPEPIMRWTAEFYRSALQIEGFCMRENDYAIGPYKCGGNAQYITKNRWIHHTTFLWDFDPKNMEYLLIPPKMPEYRKNRSHEDFLCRLNEKIGSKNLMREKIAEELHNKFTVNEIELNEAKKSLHKPHRQTTSKK